MARANSTSLVKIPAPMMSAQVNDMIVLHQDHYNDLLQARSALDGLAYMVCEIDHKAFQHPSKDGMMGGVPAEGLASILWCVHRCMNLSQEATVGALLAARPELFKN